VKCPARRNHPSFWSARLRKGEAAPSPAEEPEDLSGIRILLINDKLAAREILGSLLASMGVQPAMASSAAEGLEMLVQASASKAFELVLMDWNMPGMDGYEAVRQARQLLPPDRLPAFILVTAYGEESPLHKTLREGMAGFLHAPFSPASLHEAITAARTKGARFVNESFRA
jgi:CheY-like chemotaxis protein